MKRLMHLKVTICSALLLLGGTAQGASKSWYENFEIGYAIPSYNATTSATIDAFKSQGATSMPIGGGFGVYLPVIKDKTLLGLAFHGVGDLYSTAGQSMVFIQAGIGLSLIHSFGSEPGSGLYLRGDGGVGALSVLTTPGSSTMSSLGPHALVGTGYGFNITSDIHMMFSTNYSVQNIDGINNSALDFMINFMR
ncbi:MAG: hypothetical protein ABIQ95_12360 [Bdellovibrionia bacterium]